MTLKLEADLDILKMYPHTENKAASLGHWKSRARIENGKKLRITSSKIVTDIQIVPQQFPTNSLSCMLPLFHNRYHDMGPTTLKKNRKLDILKMYLHSKL